MPRAPLAPFVGLRAMLDEFFAESLAHKPAPISARIRGYSGHVILGRRLRPFTFWAAANLDFIKSRFAGHPPRTEIISFPDIYLATEVCRLRWPRTLNINRLDFEYRAWFYGRRFARDQKYRFDQIRAFTSYIKDYCGCDPEFVTAEGSAPVKLPWYLYHVAMLVKHAGFTQRQAWATTVSFGQWWVTALLTAAGHNIDIVTPDDRAQLAGLPQTSTLKPPVTDAKHRPGFPT